MDHFLRIQISVPHRKMRTFQVGSRRRDAAVSRGATGDLHVPGRRSGFLGKVPWERFALPTCRQRHRVEHRDTFGSLWFAPEPALCLYRHAPDRRELRLGLDALDDARDVQLKSHGGDAVHDGGVGALVGRAGGERRVELKDVDGPAADTRTGKQVGSESFWLTLE